MPTPGQRAVQIAEAEVGVREAPPGSNTGPRVRQYQAATALAGTGWAWCAAFVQWVWTVAGIRTDACSPSTQQFADRARALGWTGAPRPGAAVIWPGRHTETLTAPGNGGLWHTIGGNVSDAVRPCTRSLDGTVICVPPGLGDAPLPPRLFFLEDPAAQPRLCGPWRLKANRDRALARLTAPMRARARLIRTPQGRWAFLLGPRRVYGPWTDPGARAAAQAVLEARLGRRLRTYSRPVKTTTTSPAGARALGKTT